MKGALYRPPVRMAPGVQLKPAKPVAVPPTAAPSVDFGEVLKKLDEFFKAYANLQEMVGAAKELHGKLTDVKEGPRGAPGRDATIDMQAIARAAAALVPTPRDGKDAEVDYHKLAKRAVRHLPKVHDGANGKDADPQAVVAQIVEMIKKGEVRLHVQHLDGFEQTMSPIRNLLARGSIRGGGDTVAAGNNITLIRLANGQVQIASSAGGFTALDATETPDGTLKVFTFAAATAKPSYIVSDNVLMKATTKSGTVNWIWNAGAKQATMTVPPADDIEGIV